MKIWMKLISRRPRTLSPSRVPTEAPPENGHRFTDITTFAPLAAAVAAVIASL